MRIALVTGVFFFVFCASAAKAQTLNIDSCYEKAKRNYPLIKQYALIDQSAEFTISNANKSYLPQLSLTGIGGYLIKGLPTIGPGDESSKEKVQFIGIAQLNQTIWDGGATRGEKEITKSETAVQKAEIDVALHEVRERVNQVYFGILLLDEQQELMKVLTGNLTIAFNAVKLSNENGVAYSTDVDEVKVELLKVEQRVAEIEYARQGYLDMLSLLIGEKLSPSTKLEKPLAVAEEGSSINRPELSLYEFQRSLVAARHSMVKVGNMPKVGLLGAGIMVQPGFPFGSAKINSLAIAGLSVSWSTSMIYKSSNEKELMRINTDRIASQLETFIFNTNLQLVQQRSEVEKQRVILAKDKEIVTLKGAIKKGYELKYQNGMCSMNDLITATNSESEARGNEALHETQLLLAIYTYKTTSGN
jgi:outer membrane protein TolC